MANEFIIKNGFISQGNSTATNNLIVSGKTITNNLQLLSGATSGYVLTSDSNGNALWSSPSSLTGITDYYVTGGTFLSNTLTLNRQNGSVTITGFTSTDTYVTGFTYSNNNLTILQNQGQSPLTVNVSVMSGLTINGNLFVTGSTVIQNGLTANTIYTDYIDFNTTYVPTQQEGRVHWDVDYGTLDVDLEGNNINLKVGLDNLYYIKNQSGSTINKGRVVRAAGTLGSSGRILGEYMIADGSIPYYFTLGIAGENILNGEDGYVYEFGLVRGINTTGSLYGETWVDGTILYVSPTISGGLTSVEPIEPNLKIQMAIVIDAAANGSLFVRPSLGSNLGDLHNLQTSGQTNGDLISYNSSQGYWEYTKTLNGDYTISGNTTQIGDFNITGNALVDGSLSADTITIVNTPTLNNNLTQILGRDTTNGVIQYREINSIGNNYTYVSGSTYSATTIDNVLGIDSSISATTVYLPDSISSGRLRYDVKDIGLNSYNNNITIITSGSDTIISTENSNTVILAADGGALIIFNTGLGTWLQM